MTGTIENLPLRGMLAKWRGRRSRKRQQRALEGCLHQIDPHTLNDIGLNVLLEEATAPESRARSAVIMTLRKITGRARAGES